MILYMGNRGQFSSFQYIAKKKNRAGLGFWGYYGLCMDNDRLILLNIWGRRSETETLRDIPPQLTCLGKGKTLPIV